MQGMQQDNRMLIRNAHIVTDLRTILRPLWIILCIQGITGNPSVRSVFYLHTTPRTWNEAKLICEAETAEMLRVIGDETMEQLLYVDSSADWSGNFSRLLSEKRMWLALYETQDLGNPFLYHGCVKPEVFKWGTSQPVNTSTKSVCVAMDTAFTWSTHQCNESFYFMCQRHDGDCWFDPYVNRLGTAQTLYVDDVTVADEAACATLCRNGWVNNTECWGFSYKKSDAVCRLHYHNWSTVYLTNTEDNLIVDADWIFYPKICVGGLLRSVDVSYANDNLEPHVLNCTDLVTTGEDWDNGVCYCECRNPPPLWEPTISSLTLEQKINMLVAALSIDAKNTSAAQRKLKSAVDERPSAQSIGYVGIVFLSLVFGSVLILDINVLVLHSHKLIKQLKDPNSSTA